MFFSSQFWTAYEYSNWFTDNSGGRSVANPLTEFIGLNGDVLGKDFAWGPATVIIQRKNIHYDSPKEEKGHVIGFVYSCFLNLKNPITVDFKNGRFDKTQDFVLDGYVHNLDSVGVVDYAKKRGNDGAIIQNVLDGAGREATLGNIDYVVFDSTQIKLADGSNTTFNKRSKDIRMGDGGQPSTTLHLYHGSGENNKSAVFYWTPEKKYADWFARAYKGYVFKDTGLPWIGHTYEADVDVSRLGDLRELGRKTTYKKLLAEMQRRGLEVPAFVTDNIRDGYGNMTMPVWEVAKDLLLDQSQVPGFIIKESNPEATRFGAVDAYVLKRAEFPELVTNQFADGGSLATTPIDLRADLGFNFGDKLRKTGEIIVAHSTSSKLLPKIIKEGLSPDAEKTWEDSSKGKLFFEIEPTSTQYGENVYGWKACQKYGGVPITLYVRIKTDKLKVDRDDEVLGFRYQRNQRECSCSIPPEDILGLKYLTMIDIKPEDFMEFYKMIKDYEDGGQIQIHIPDKTARESSRFKPYETVVFSNPMVGPNGNKLVSYQWAYEWTMLPNNEGELIGKRVSDWTQAENSAETGRDIVHKFTIERKDGTSISVSSESVPAALGYESPKEMENFSSLVSAVKTLAKQKLKLAILEQRQQEYDELYRKLMHGPKPSIIQENQPNEDRVKWMTGDAWVIESPEFNWTTKQFNKIVSISPERKETLEEGWVRRRIAEAGISKPESTYELKNRIARQEKKVKIQTFIN